MARLYELCSGTTLPLPDISTGQPVAASSSGYGTSPTSANDGDISRSHPNEHCSSPESIGQPNSWWSVELVGATRDPTVPATATLPRFRTAQTGRRRSVFQRRSK